jgi:phospholipid transport system substrate-binding protein
MIAKKYPNPVDRILASLDESPEIENYPVHEIEALPIEEVRRRLDELGIDSSFPGYIKSLSASFASPAQKIVDSLDDEELSTEQIERLAPEEVRAKLNSLGQNYLSGIHKIRQLTSAMSDRQQETNETWWSRILTRLKIAGAVAAIARLVEPISGAKLAGFAAGVTALLAFVFVFSNWNPPADQKAQIEQEKTSSEQIAGLPKWRRQSSSEAAALSAPSVRPASFGGHTTTERISAASERGAVAPPGGAQEGVRAFYNVLLGTMKDRTLGKSDRYQTLASIVESTFDLPYMVQLVIGQPVWTGLPPVQQQKVTEALRYYIAATYADNFASYSGEELWVTGERAYGEGVIVQSKIVQSNGETDFVDYLMRHDQGSWRISDAYVDGAISELAKLRSEFFRPILQREGVEGLIRELNRLAA